MKIGTKLWMAAWLLALFIGAIFLLSLVATLAFSPFGEAPIVLTTINGFLMPWGVLAMILAIVLRRIAGRSIRKKQAAHG